MVAKSGQANLGCVLTALALFYLIGRCGSGADKGDSADASIDTDVGAEAGSLSEAMPSRARFVAVETLNCRSAPNPDSPVVAQLRYGDQVRARVTSASWIALDRAPFEKCWVKQSLVRDHLPPQVTRPQALFGSVPERRPTGGPLRALPSPACSCGTKRTCGEMASCGEANFYLNQCGLSRLDRDHDGVPCESIC
ncbi:excalibur calcium-binding domain-containing protein [Sphingorhabdus contaminans]|uniref:Excalibur calcium-binding domain-containing protein n=1 Tax=Sphingorhabdus contaminans TaxID=1343899 RepID=A0A553WA91_9SPHN|nr:excalibur calcium-binding domain-containing protein [Sphingorhabdus contaminans]TSB01591.1 hypothetical protein FOM92_10420 [Sphingorhabdus contaminans]